MRKVQQVCAMRTVSAAGRSLDHLEDVDNQVLAALLDHVVYLD